MYSEKQKRAITCVLALTLAFAAGYWAHSIVDDAAEEGHEVRLEGYRFINPLLECESSTLSKRFHELRPFKNEILTMVNAHLAKGKARSIVVYFRDLNNGPWFSINEQEKFIPGSMMKVPFMIALLKRAEGDPSLLQKKIRYDGGVDMMQYQHFQPKEALRPGSWYTVDDLLFRMIAYSDNNAAKLLLTLGDGTTIINKVMDDLHINFDIGTAGNVIRVKDYSAFMRVLFNAAYLNHEMSERALGYLARSTFAVGIRAGITRDIAAATKFGEYYVP